MSLLATLVWATGSDIAKEQRWAEQVVDALLDGEQVWLDDGAGHKFLGIYTPADATKQLAVILIHGSGAHPDWPDVIHPLRAGLLEQDTTTLSLQMPVLANDAAVRDYIPLISEAPRRISAGIDYLHEQGFSQIVLVAHSMGAGMASQYLASAAVSPATGLVIIGMNPGIIELRNLTALANIRVPILDLYGSEDLPGVLNFVEARAKAVASGVNYTQVQVDGANHFFQGHEAALLSQVGDWIAAR